MSKSKGWVSIHRSIQDHWLWNHEPFSRGQAWVDLVIGANHTDGKLMIKGQLILLSRGQQARSMITLTDKWRWSRGKVKRFLNMLENEQMIVQQTNHLTSIITICNYNEFQDKIKHGGTPDKSTDDTTGDHLTTRRRYTNNNVNNVNNENKTTNQKKNNFSSDDMKCAEYIYKSIQHLDQSFEKSNLDSWANDIRLMCERDKRTHKEICDVFKWANNDDFWKTNILSPATLRKQFTKLKTKMVNPSSGGSKPEWQKIPFDDNAVDDWVSKWGYPICPPHIQTYKLYKEQILKPAIQTKIDDGYQGNNSVNTAA